MEKIDWSKAPEGATHWERESYGASAGWMRNDGGDWFFLSSNGHWLKHIISNVSAVRLANMVKRPSPSWSGEGLPPVGVVCEVDWCEEWHKCEVIAHFQQRCGMVAAFTVEISGGAKSLYAFGADSFRPIRTPEQIAADEREAAIKDMLEDAGRPDTAKTRDQAQLLYDAGWRKVERAQ